MDIFQIIKAFLSETEKMLPVEDQNALVHTHYNELDQYHFGLGTWMRNQLLKDESGLYQLMKNAGIKQTDEMSYLLIRLLYLHLKINIQQENISPHI